VQSGVGSRHPLTGLLPISWTSQVSSSIPPANYDEQLGTTFSQNFVSIAYNVTAVAQSDTYGYGPAYLLNGLSSSGYWYQIGISYDWPFTAGGYNPGFGMNYEVFDPQGASIFPTSGGGGLSSVHVDPGDSVLLKLNFSGRNVIMSVKDWNTGSSASQTFSAARATSFLGLTSAFANQNGFFTGLMTEWYHVAPYYSNEEESTFSNYSHSLPSAWLWMDEFNVATSQLLFSDASKTPLAFLSSPSQLQPFYSHGAYEAVDAYEFVTGFQPPPVQVSRPILRTVSVDVGQLASFTCNATGGIPPFTYSWTFGDGSVATGQNVTHPFSSPGTVDVQCTVIDSLQTTSQNATSIVVLSDPSINLLTANPTSSDLGQTVTLAVEATGGSTDYTYEWMNLPTGCNLGNTASISCQPTTTGTFEVAVNITDSNGFSLISSNLSVNVYPDPLTSFTASSSSLDEGQTIEFAASPSGGVGDLSLAYYNLPTGCESANSTNLACSPATSGTYQATVTVTDSNGFTISSSPVTITVNPDPTANIIASPPSIDLGQTFAITLLVHGGTGPFSYSFTMLPPGCGTSTSSELSCTPSALGNYTVEGFVSDATGQTSIGYLSVTVNSVIRISTFTTSPESVDSGQEVTLAVSTTGGAGPLTYSYSDLPMGCSSTDSPILHCTPSTSGTYLVKATVTDHAGKNATSSLNITVLPAKVIGPSSNQAELLVGVIITSLIAIGVMITGLSKRRKGP